MNPTIRAFVAIDVGPAVKTRAHDLQKSLNAANADCAWTPPRNMHMTLKFLGDVSVEQIESIKTLLSKVAAETPAFNCAWDKLSAFPDTKRPRVIWFGSVNKECAALARAIDRALAAIGFAPETRDFHAHVTLGRVRSGKNVKALVDLMESLAVKAVSQPCGKIVLYKSTLTPGGAIYEPLWSAPLSGYSS